MTERYYRCVWVSLSAALPSQALARQLSQRESLLRWSLYHYRAHRAGVGGAHSQRHLVGRDVAGDGDSQSPFHLVYLGAEPGTLGAADAEFRVYECFNVGTTSIQNKKRR